MAEGPALTGPGHRAGMLSARCAIAGGGPAGMMLGVLLARAGIEVVVLEKHADFLRDFRGDTVHPSTLEVIHELGWLEDFLRLPHQKARTLAAQIGESVVSIADFTHLPTQCGFIALMPQWDFLNFLAEKGARYPAFRLLTRAEVTDLVEEGSRVAGLKASTIDGPIEVRADLIVGADGRTSVVRERAKLVVHELGAPMDVLWFRLSRSDTDSDETMGRFDAGRIFITINRGDYWQCGFVIPKGSVDEIRQRGLPAFREDIARLSPMLHDRVQELDDWDAVKLLTVRVDRLERWHRPGLLCIGDAAHAMSPIGGVGINLAIQDAVATANILATPLLERRVRDQDLHAVQSRREFPTRLTQGAQVLIQSRIISPLLGRSKTVAPPLPLRLLNAMPPLRRIPARLLGLGVRPEHVRTPVFADARPRV
ncbi:MAG TPA: FAD-dependent oxidoreductase [Stellaceae bacterium]|nr:FAD-dependent oxidoreductase [Stellaceae bacterium]